MSFHILTNHGQTRNWRLARTNAVSWRNREVGNDHDFLPLRFAHELAVDVSGPVFCGVARAFLIRAQKPQAAAPLPTRFGYDASAPRYERAKLPVWTKPVRACRDARRPNNGNTRAARQFARARLLASRRKQDQRPHKSAPGPAHSIFVSA